MNNPSGRILRNVLFNWANYGFNLVIAFFLSPFLVRSLGDSGYGLWTLIASLTGYLGLLDFGVRVAVMQYIARFHAAAAHERSGRVLGTALVIFSTAGAVAMGLSVLFALFVNDLFQIPPGRLVVAQYIVVLGGATVAVSLIGGVFGGIVVGLQRLDLLNTLQIVSNALRALAIVLALTSGYGLLALAWIQLSFSVAGGLGSAWLCFRLYPELRGSFGSPDLEHMRLIFSFSLFSFLIGVGGQLIYATDTVVVGAFLPVSLVTFYVIGGQLVESARGLLAGVSTAITPAASALDARQERQALQRLLFGGVRLMTLVALPIGVAFLVRGQTFIGLWMGPQFADLSSRVLQILAVSLMFTAATYPGMSIVLGMRKHRAVVPAMLAEGIVNLVLSVLLVGRLGLVGVAWGTTIPSVIRDVIFWPWFLKRVLGVSPYEFATTGWLRPAIGIVPYAVLSYLIDRHWPTPNLVIFFLQVGLALPVAILPLWFTSFTPEQRKSHWGFAMGLMPAGRRPS